MFISPLLTIPSRHRDFVSDSDCETLGSDGGAHPARFDDRNLAFFRVDDAEALHDPELTALGLGDVHVHSNVMLTGHHFGRTTWTLGDLGVVERLDDIVLLERPRLFHGS